MADITMCVGGGCPYKEFCYRHIAEADTYQSYFVKVPWYDKNGKAKCDYFWETRKEFTK